MSEFEDFFEKAGAGGGPSFKFEGIGSGLKGEVVSFQLQNQTKFKSDEVLRDDNGQPLKQMQVVLQTELRNYDKTTPGDGDRNPADDDGRRAIYVKTQMAAAIKEALQAAGVKTLATGGILAVKKVGEKPTSKGNPQNIFEARYEAPAATADAGFFEDTPAEAPASNDEPPF